MLLYLAIIFLLFGLVNHNFRKNQNKLRNRSTRNFRENFQKKKETKNKESL